MDTDRVLALSDQIRQKAVQTASDPIQSRSRLLQLIDELRLVVKTPTKTVLRLIYQVICHNRFIYTFAVRLTSTQTP